MTNAPISALRRRMIEDMTSRRLAPRTQQAYIRALRFFFGVTLGRQDATERLPFVREPRKLRS